MEYQVTFSYDALQDSAKQAKKAASRLDSYQSEFQKKIIKKLNHYKGRSCGYLDDAQAAASRKYTALGRKVEMLERYQSDLEGIVTACKSTDRMVATRVKTLCGDFTTRHGIHVGALENVFEHGKISIRNTSRIGRFTGDVVQEGKDIVREGISDLSYWYQYEGGKYVLWENAKTILTTTLAVAGAVVALLTAGTALAVISAAVGAVAAVFTLANGVTDVAYNQKAAAAAKAGDPASAYRLNQVESVSDSLRLSYNQSDHDWANAYDAVKATVDTLKLVTDVANMTASGIEWVTNGKFDAGKMDIWEAKWSDVKQGVSLKLNNFKQGASQFGSAIKGGRWTELRRDIFGAGKRYLLNIKEGATKDFRTFVDVDKEAVTRASAGIKWISSAVSTGTRTIDHFILRTDVRNDDFWEDTGKDILNLGASGFAGRSHGSNKKGDISIDVSDTVKIFEDGYDLVAKDGVSLSEHLNGRDSDPPGSQFLQAARRLKEFQER